MNVNGTTNVNTYSTSAMRWEEPGFNGACGTNHPGYTVWSGLGGFNYNNGAQRLIQSGIDIADTNIYDPYFFWEIFLLYSGQTQSIGTAEVHSYLNVNAYDSVGTVTSYSSNGANFLLQNFTQNTSVNIGPVKGYNAPNGASYPIADFYDGSTSDFISESPQVSKAYASPNGYAYLAYPTNGGVYISYATSNWQDLQNNPSWRLTEISDYNHNPVQVNNFDGVHAWTDTHKQCY